MKLHRRSCPLGLLLVSLLGFAVMTQAQGVVSVYDPGASAAMISAGIGNQLVVQNQLRNAFSAVERASKAQPGQAAAQSGNRISNGSAASAALQYRPSPSVSTALRQELAEHMAKANPAQAQNIRQALSTDAIWKEFSRLLSSLGYSSTNVADVMTGYYVINWEVVNGADASDNIQGIRAARDRFAAALVSNPDFAAMSDADKQRFAESMGYVAAVAGAGKNELMKAGNRAGLAELQQAVHQSMLQTYGVDLKQLKLTSQGFAQG